jgi:radical SAM/Cys-rich protein
MNPYFKHLVKTAREMGVHVIDRCNLTILQEPGHEELAAFLANHGVEVIASMPCYLEDNVNAQRGAGVFEKSIRGLQKLNALGYGIENELIINLVYNPQGPSLPPSQAELEPAYKQALFDNYGISFNRLFTLVNMPIKRFGSTLLSKGEFESYMHALKSSHNDENLESVMCKSLISVDWQGIRSHHQWFFDPLFLCAADPHQHGNAGTAGCTNNPGSAAGYRVDSCGSMESRYLLNAQ